MISPRRVGQRLVLAAGLGLVVVASATGLAAAASHSSSQHLGANPNLAFVLFVLGLAGMCFEITHPGLNVPGLAGLVAFIVSLVLLGRLPVDAAGVILLVSAFILFLIELRVGAHSVLGMVGVVCLVLGGLFLYDPSVPSAKVALPLLIGIAVVLGGFFILVARVALKTRDTPVVSGADTLIGEEGVVTQVLHPVGQARVRGEVWAATLDDPDATAAVGARIVVSDLRGLTLYVAPLNQTQASPSAIRPPGGNER